MYYMITYEYATVEDKKNIHQGESLYSTTVVIETTERFFKIGRKLFHALNRTAKVKLSYLKVISYRLAEDSEIPSINKALNMTND